MVFETRFKTRLSSNSNVGPRYTKDSFSHTPWALWIPSHALWPLQRAINVSGGHERCPESLLAEVCSSFFYDILVYNATLTNHLQHLECVFTSLSRAQYYLKRSKCIFRQHQLDYLGHVVSGSEVQPDPSKVQAIISWPIPQSSWELWAFLDLTGFYRKFIKGYAAIAAPLTKLLCKDAFKWVPESQSAFERLKGVVTTAPVLALPNFALPFAVEIDASSYAMGVVLHQQGHPIAFFNKPFCSRLQHASAYVRELHAIVATVCKWRQYLLGHKFTVYIDHRSLYELMSQIVQTPE